MVFEHEHQGVAFRFSLKQYTLCLVNTLLCLDICRKWMPKYTHAADLIKKVEPALFTFHW